MKEKPPIYCIFCEKKTIYTVSYKLVRKITGMKKRNIPIHRFCLEEATWGKW